MSAPKTETVSFVSGELFGSKQRALLQRRKNRVLFDLHHGLDQLALDRDKLIDCFKPYRAPEGKPIMRAVAERRMLEKLTRSLRRGGGLIRVDPRNTSRTCVACGHVSEENRPDQATFRCISCGYSDHADVNAAKNILRAGQARSACSPGQPGAFVA